MIIPHHGSFQAESMPIGKRGPGDLCLPLRIDLSKQQVKDVERRDDMVEIAGTTGAIRDNRSPGRLPFMDKRPLPGILRFDRSNRPAFTTTQRLLAAMLHLVHR